MFSEDNKEVIQEDILEEDTEEIDEKVKKPDKTKVVAFILFGLVVIVGLFVFLPDVVRRVNIIKNMKSIYSGASFPHLKVDREPVSKQTLEEYYFLGGEIPKEDLYTFIIEDDQGNNGWGYCTKLGDVVFDNYAGKYYMADTMEYFEKTADMKAYFPDLDYYVLDTSPDNYQRLVYTKDCGTFEGYLHSRMVGNYSIIGAGYPTIWVMVKTEDREDIYRINKVLRRADFEVYVRFFEMKEGFEAGQEEKGLGDNMGYFYPHGASYLSAVIGDHTYDVPIESDVTLLSVTISLDGNIQEDYIVGYDGEAIKRVYSSASDYTETSVRLSDEDYRMVLWYAFAAESDITVKTITSGTPSEGMNIRITMSIIYPAMTVRRNMYNVDTMPEDIIPVMEMLNGYF